MMRLGKRFLMTLTLIALTPVVAMGADKPGFSKADANGNGKVSIKEAKKAGIPAEEAKANDLNDDGKLTETDWEFVDMKDKSSGNSS